ncbi:MAG TPA: hypothetical protein VGY55_19805 [Pirellulales bacterium]|jgi:hypothetical protein|nr:hypothetical protein [Pirellulales bacterium]
MRHVLATITKVDTGTRGGMASMVTRMQRAATDIVVTVVPIQLTAVEGAVLAAAGILACAARCMGTKVCTGVTAAAECIADAAAGRMVSGATAAGADLAAGAAQCMGIMAVTECLAVVGSMADMVIAADPAVAARWDLTIVDLVVGGKAGRAVASTNGAAVGADPAVVGAAVAWVDPAAGAAASAMGRADTAVDSGADRVLVVADSEDSASVGQDLEAMGRAILAADHGADQDLEGSASAVRNSVVSVTAAKDSVATGRAGSRADRGTMTVPVGRDSAARAAVVAASVTKVSVAGTSVARASANGVNGMAPEVNATATVDVTTTTLDRSSAARRADSVSVVPVAAILAPVGQA